MRTFLAIAPPPEVLRNIGTLQNRLQKDIQGVIRWVRPEGIHLTLKFFGEVSPEAVEKIDAAVSGPTAAVAPFNLAVRGVGVFPDVNRPRVVWVGIAGEIGALAALQRELERKLAAAGFPPEERPFRAHLTLGRVKVPRGIVGLSRAVETGAGVEAGIVPVREVALFKSELTPRGAVYTRLASYPLQGVPPAGAE